LLECAAVGSIAAAGISVLRILLVAQAFPPFNASGAVRVAKLASYLIDRGHDVRVITASPLPYPRTLPIEVSAERIIRTSSMDPFAFFAWLRRRQSERSGGTSNRSLLGTGYRGRFLRFVGAVFAMPEAQVGWYPSAVAAGRRLMRSWRPDVIYASALPFTAHLVASRLARSSQVPWVAEFRDLFADNPYSNLPAWRAPIDRWLERRVVSSASACVTVSEPMAATLRARHRKPAMVVLNGYAAQAAQVAPAPDKDAPLRILYTGVIYPGRRDPSPLFAAIASLGALRTQVEVTFYGQDLPGVAELAVRYGVSDQVRVRGPIPHAESLLEQHMADVLLLLLWSHPLEAGVYTGKLFEYIGAGRPILSVGAEDGVAAHLIRDRGLGVVAADPHAIASSLRLWIAEKRSTGYLAGPPDSAKTGMSRHEQFALIDELLHSLVDGVVAHPPLPSGSHESTPQRT
jgi:glycosyltransferase involved in cell wall biosynthesis